MEVRKVRKAEAVFGKVLSEIKPSAAETNETIASINTVMHRLGKIVEHGVGLKVVGSIARGTNLKGESDVDIFVLFHKKTETKELVRKGLAYGKALASGKRDRYEIKYAEHPYIRLYLEELAVRIDLVPALKIDNIEEMGTTVDRTPLHADFINSNLNEKQRDEARVLKYLLKMHNIYGAEVRVGGFPGYLCEILIYQFGSLLRLLDNVALFSPPIILDPKTKNRLSDTSLIKRFNSNFIVIDPVDPNRNVAAGVSTESLARFIMLARRFVKEPSLKCFYGTGFSSLSAKNLVNRFVKNSGFSIYLVYASVPDKSEDIVWPQLRKVANMITELASRYDYQVYLTIPWISKGKGYMLFITPKDAVGTRMIKGPDVFMHDAAQNFMKEHPAPIGTVLKGASIYLIEKNRYGTMESFLRAAIRSRLVGRHKDIDLRNAKLFVGRLPNGLAEDAYSEIIKKITL